MDLLGLEAFIAIVEWGSVSEAARRTGHPKSTLSRRLAELERGLSARLLERSRSAVRLTEEGRTLLNPAKALLDEAASLKDLMRGRSGGASGRLRVSAPNLLGQTALADIAARYCAAHPQVALEVSLSDRYVDLVADGFDCALRTAHQKDPDLISRKIFSSDLILVARRGFQKALAAEDPAGLASLASLAFLSSGERESWTLRNGARTERLRPACAIAADSLPMIRRVLDGVDAVALLPHFLVEDGLRDGSLIRVCPEWRGATHDVFVVFSSKRHMPQRLRDFIDMTAAHFASRSAKAT